MARRIGDADVRMLASFAATLEPDYVDLGAQQAWEGSPFAWIRSRPSRQKGKIGEQLVAGWCAAKGFDVVRSPDAEAGSARSASTVQASAPSSRTELAVRSASSAEAR